MSNSALSVPSLLKCFLCVLPDDQFWNFIQGSTHSRITTLTQDTRYSASPAASDTLTWIYLRQDNMSF